MTTPPSSPNPCNLKGKISKKTKNTRIALTVSRAPIISYPILNRTRFYHSLGPVTRVARIPYRGVLRPSRYTQPDLNKPSLILTSCSSVRARGHCVLLLRVYSARTILVVGKGCVCECVTVLVKSKSRVVGKGSV